MKKIRNLTDVVNWDLCIGCGACYYYCNKGAVTLVNIENQGIRPRIDREKCIECTECLSFCPGYRIDNGFLKDDTREYNPYIGNTLEIWEGHASDRTIRYRGSSGGILSAIALYYLELEKADFVLHTGSNPEKPWLTMSIQSHTKDEIVKNAGSRYIPSSPCENLNMIEKTKGKALFIGKPCDAAAVSLIRKSRPVLDKKLGAVLSFFCAGTPSTLATKELIKKAGMDSKSVSEVRYRGNGWPGFFIVKDKNGRSTALTYEESWGYISSYKPFRCNLCPDGLGELSDITCGDAWHRHEDSDPGRSLILVRTERGKALLKKVKDAGYITIEPSGIDAVIKAQPGLTRRRKELFGRLLALKIMRRPFPLYSGFSLNKIWKGNALIRKIKIIAGTIRRLITKKLLRPVDPFN